MAKIALLSVFIFLGSIGVSYSHDTHMTVTENRIRDAKESKDRKDLAYIITGLIQKMKIMEAKIKKLEKK